MKKTTSYFFACIIGSILFFGCSPKVASTRLGFNVVTASNNSKNVGSMTVEFYKNGVYFFKGNTQVASFVEFRGGTLPPPIPPCNSIADIRCNDWQFIKSNESYWLISPLNKGYMQLKANKINKVFDKAIEEMPNQQFRLTEPKLVKRMVR